MYDIGFIWNANMKYKSARSNKYQPLLNGKPLSNYSQKSHSNLSNVVNNVINEAKAAQNLLRDNKSFANGRALGGQVRAGESYLVGERGPELLTMGTSGKVTSNDALKNSGNGADVVINQTINVTTGIQSTVRAEIVALMPQISNAAKGAVADARLRGGNFSKAMAGA